MPDIDIDFLMSAEMKCWSMCAINMGKIVAQICTFGTLAARASVKDVGRVMGLNFADMNGFANSIPERPELPWKKPTKLPDLRKALEENPRFAEIWGIAKRLEGGVRHVSVHTYARS